MSTGEQPPIGEHPQSGYNAGDTVMYPRETETACAIREDQFITLCEGEVNEAKANYKECRGYAFGAVIGMAGVIAASDGQSIWVPGHFWLHVSCFVLFALATGSVVGSYIHWRNYKRRITDSAFARTKAGIVAYFEKVRSNPAVPTGRKPTQAGSPILPPMSNLEALARIAGVNKPR